MKVIDLLNRIANGEIEIKEEPKKIEKFDKDKMFIDDNYGYSINWEYLENTLNEIIDYINKGE